MNNRFMTYLGIDIGGTRIKTGFVNDDGEILDRRAISTPTESTLFTSTLRDVVAELVKTNGLPAAVGIGSKGVVNPVIKRVVAQPGTYQFLEEIDFSSLFDNILPGETPLAIDNDARVALVGEKLWGAARNRQNVILLTLGTGVGGAVMAEGQILRGMTGVAGHIGHITVVPNGKICICGNRGCLETVFSARAIEAAALDAVLRGCDSQLTNNFAKDLQKITCEAVFTIAATGDAVAELIVSDAIKHLATAIAGLLNTLDPEIVIIGGQIAEAGEALFAPLKQEIGWRARGFVCREVPLVLPEVKDTSGIIGAAALAICSASINS